MPVLALKNIVWHFFRNLWLSDCCWLGII